VESAGLVPGSGGLDTTVVALTGTRRQSGDRCPSHSSDAQNCRRPATRAPTVQAQMTTAFAPVPSSGVSTAAPRIAPSSVSLTGHVAEWEHRRLVRVEVFAV